MNSSGPDRGHRIEIGRLNYGRLHCTHARARSSSTPTHPPLSSAGAGGAAGEIRHCVCDSLRHSHSGRSAAARAGPPAAQSRVVRRVGGPRPPQPSRPRPWGRRKEGGSRGTTPSSARLRASSAAPALPSRMAAFTSLPAGAELRHTNRPGRASPSLNRLGASCNACNDDWDWEREKPKAHVLLPMPTNGLYRPPNNGHFKGTLLRYFLEPCVDLEENCNPLHKKEIKNLYPPEGQ